MLIIEIEGGVVTAVYGDKIEGLTVVVRDLDNIEAGDPDPIDPNYKPEEYYA